MYLLNTDHISLFQRNHPQVTARILATASNELATTIVTYEEQMWGRLNRIRQAKQDEAIVRAYHNLQQTLTFFQKIGIVGMDIQAQGIFRELKSQKIRVGTQDLRIAAIALKYQAVLVTRNKRDFARVPSLILEDWTNS